MKHVGIKLMAILLFSSQVSLVKAQVQKGVLSKNKTITAEIAPNEKHQYKVALGKDQFALLKLMQKGVDLKITTYDSKGEKLEDFDSPNGKNGPEYISITSNTRGEYLIEIYPINEKQPKGNYELRAETIKPKATSANKQVDELFAAWNSTETPGAAVAVVKNGKIVYKNGYGMANLEYNIPISPSSIFHVASVSKQFTVFSILLLEKAGKLSLEDDIRKYIPEVPDFGKTITLRHLASHTSGLRDQWDLLAMAGWRMDDVITKEHILKMVSNQKNLNFAPGEEYLYCNTGFTLLAEVVSRVSGKSFAAFTKANIFEPLHMHNTLFYDDHEKIVKNRVYSYYADSTGYKKSLLSFANVGATSLFTTVEDLSLWALNFSDFKVGDAAMANKMNTLAVLNNGKTFNGALGQFVITYKGLKEILHDGADAGYRASFSRFPDQNFSVIVLSNESAFNPGKIAHKIADIYLQDKIKAEPKKVVPKQNNTPEGIPIDQKTLNAYVGDYELQPGFIISITQNKGQLQGQGTGQPILPLTAISATEFAVKGIDAKITFIADGKENAKLIKLAQGGKTMDAPRVKRFEQSVNLSDLTGRFYSEELSTAYELKIKDKNLIAQHSRLSDIQLKQVKNDSFSGDTFFFSQVKFIRDTNNKITGFNVSSSRSKNLYFRKMD